MLQSEGAGPGWVLLLARLPASPSGPRVALWRRARAAGAAGLQNGVWVLPRTAEHAELFGQLAETVRGQGGSAFVLAVPRGGRRRGRGDRGAVRRRPGPRVRRVRRAG